MTMTEKNFFIKKILHSSYFYMILTILFLEILLRINVFKNIQWSFIYVLCFGINSAFLLSFLSCLLTQKYNKVLYGVFLFIICLYFCSQILYYDFFKVFLTVYSISHGGQVAEFWQDITNLIINNSLWILLCFLPFILYIFYERKYIILKRLNEKKVLFHFCCMIISFLLGYGLLYIPTHSLNKPIDIYQEKTMNELTVNQLGLMSACRLDIQSFLFGKDDNIEIETNQMPEEEKKEIVYNPQTMDIDFNQLIANTQNKTIKNMHQYFQEKEPTQKNQYTGMFKGYNVILLTCEGFSPYAIDKELTPTLFKLKNEGFVFNQFYTPLWHVSTSDGEYVALQGLIPKSGTWSFQASSKNDLPFTLGKQFQKLGYTTKAYHDHSYTYYGRNQSHPNLGYDFKAVGHGLTLKKQWPESDLEMMQKTVDDYIHEEHFHTYYMTVSGHTNYTFEGNSMAAKNKKYVDHLDYSDLTKGYLASQIELDRALEYLITRLTEAKIADKTLIVMSADHYPYGLPRKNYNELAGHTIEEDFELYKNEFIIWSGSMEKPIIIDKLGCSLDILPTLSNLLGLEYDSRLLMGTDLLSDSDPLVIFENKSFITDKVMYNSKTQKATWLNQKEDMNYLQTMNTIIKQKISYSQKILDYNYYKYIQ